MAEKYIKMKTESNKKKKKRKNFIKIIMLFIVLISVLVTLCLKLSYFNVQQIDVAGNRNIGKEEIIKLSRIARGNNIFYVNLKASRTNLLSNSNILDVHIKRVFPSKIVITIKERDAVFYIQRDSKYLIIDKEGIIIEEKDSIEALKLIRLDDIKTENAVVGKRITAEDKRTIELIGKITELYNNNISKYSMTSANISNLLNINICYGNMCIKIGTADEIEKKLNKAINVMDTQGLADKKGYIDVSYEGNPVFYIEK